MDRKTDTLYFLHIRDAIALIVAWSDGKTIKDFAGDEKLQSAIIRQLEIIGEAARNVSDERKLATPEIPWRPITDARNTLIHGYFTVDEKKVWDMVQIDIPVLQKQIVALLQDVEKE
ncbi:MAG: DUF86 domain-containing protein [Candidatus Gottesmanbacteria bacterium]|nr:DUF86 domain-containing protein [Candidatus Gottesmanbacteria bacterium]